MIIKSIHDLSLFKHSTVMMSLTTFKCYLYKLRLKMFKRKQNAEESLFQLYWKFVTFKHSSVFILLSSCLVFLCEAGLVSAQSLSICQVLSTISTNTKYFAQVQV